MKFVTDENIHKATVAFLRQLGHHILDIKEMWLFDLADPDILGLARREDRILLPLDKGLGDIRMFLAGTCPAIVILRLKPVTIEKINAALDWSLKGVTLADVRAALVIVGEDKSRIRRKPP